MSVKIENGSDYDEMSSNVDMSSFDTEIEMETNRTQFVLDKSAIKDKLLKGELKLCNKKGRSRIWKIFSEIESNECEKLSGVVACKTCKNIYVYTGKSTSNLIRHKCYAIKDEEKIEVNAETKEKALTKITEWTLRNCRPFKIVEDSGFHKVAEYLVAVGASYGPNVDIKTLLPHTTTVTRNINKVYELCFQRVKEEINCIKDNGFGITSDLWTDNYINKTYIAITIHFIKEGKLLMRLLAIKSVKGEKCTSQNIYDKVSNVIKLFELDLNRAIVVSDGGANMVAAFRTKEHIFCIDHLLHNTMQKSMQEVEEFAELCGLCTKLVKYFKITSLNSNLQTTLKSFSSTRWNTIFPLFVSIERNWAELVQQLEQKNEMNRIENININHITAIIKILEKFQETFKILEGENYPTIHLVFVHIYRLKKICNSCAEDIDMIKRLKEKLSFYLDTIVLKNLSNYHKIALFLFPPANKLIHFDEEERTEIKLKCKEIMENFTDHFEPEVEDMTTATISNANNELFSDFLKQPDYLSSIDRSSSEILAYEALNVKFFDDFNLLEWWHLHRKEFPQIYKASCRILAAPASSAASERVFSRARNVISEKKCRIASNDISVNKITFLHINMKENSTNTL